MLTPKNMICAGHPPAQDLWQARVDSVRPTFEEAAKEMGKAKIDQEAHPVFWKFRNQQKTPQTPPNTPFFWFFVVGGCGLVGFSETKTTTTTENTPHFREV